MIISTIDSLNLWIWIILLHYSAFSMEVGSLQLNENNFLVLLNIIFNGIISMA